MKGIPIINTINIFFLGVIFLSFSNCKNDDTPTPVAPPPAHSYYVAPTGSDVNTGTVDAPFKTIAKALNKVVPGDTVLVRGGTYYEKISFPKSGTSAGLITLKAYAGEKPVIDGTYLSVTGYWEGLVTFSNVRFITLDGFDICNVVTAAPYVDPEGITIKNGCTNITVRNCNIYNIKSNATSDGWRSAHAIVVLGNSDQSVTKNIVIDGCTIHDTQTGTSETLTIAGNVDGFTVSNNKIYDIENIGIIIAGGDNLNPTGTVATNYARNGVIRDNEVYNNSHSRSPHYWGENAYGAIAIYVCGGANTIIERNKVYDSDRGIGLVSESNTYATKDCIVRNNFVYNCWRTGIYMGDYQNYTTGGTKNCYVVNNTLFQNNKVVGHFDEIEGEIRLTENCTGNVIRNNIIYARPVDVFIHKYSNTGSNNIIDDNLYYTEGTPAWIWNSVDGEPFTSFTDWQVASGVDASSISEVNPLIISTSLPDLHLQSDSPAKNSGTMISADIQGSTDIDGNARIVNNKISKGAHQGQ
jgi:hypothetical protein